MDRQEGQSENEYKPIINIFDSDFIPFYVLNIKKGEEEKTLEQYKYQCDNFIENINKATNADYYIGYLTIGKCFRYDINPSYKANRKYDNLPKYLNELKEYLANNHNFIGQVGYEADDLVISFKAQNSQYESIIVSPDKDILNLEGKHFNPRKMEFKETSNEESIEYFWKSMICGDTIDGIKGIPGKGEKYFYNEVYNEENLGIGLPFLIFNEYIQNFGEYEGIKEFYKNFMSLRLVDTIKLEDIKLNKTNKITF